MVPLLVEVFTEQSSLTSVLNIFTEQGLYIQRIWREHKLEGFFHIVVPPLRFFPLLSLSTIKPGSYVIDLIFKSLFGNTFLCPLLLHKPFFLALLTI